MSAHVNVSIWREREREILNSSREKLPNLPHKLFLVIAISNQDTYGIHNNNEFLKLYATTVNE